MNKEELKDVFAWKGMKSIEFRLLGWLWRAALIMGFAVYMATNAVAAWKWAQVKWVRTQDISRLDALLKEAAARDDFSWAGTWMADRPLADTDELVARSAPYSAALPVFVFFDFSDRADRRGDSRGADLWNMIAHYRLRFDLLRCGLDDGVAQGRAFFDVLALLHKNYYRDIPNETRRRLARKVLDFDEKYPAADNPAPLCKLLARINHADYTPLQRSEWESFRRGLRYSTEFTLKTDGTNLYDKLAPAPGKAAAKGTHK